jgi:acetolactate synthase-1/2/3 large subunit
MNKAMSNDQVPIHPLRLCKEVKDFMRRDAILVVDGQEILNFGRQSIPTFVPGHRLNSGPFGTMGVGLPFAIGAKVARPDAQVVVLHGDGSYGINGNEMDSAVRHNIPVLAVISNNGGWTADPDRNKPGPQPGLHPLGQGGPGRGRPRRARGEARRHPPGARARVGSGKPAVVNVVTDYKARATTVRFSAYST